MPEASHKAISMEGHLKDNPCVCFNLRKAARVITQIYDTAMRPLGYRATQITILLAVRKLGPVTVSALSEATLTDRTTLTRNFKPLERKGLLAIRSGEDRREKEVVITTKGQKILDLALPVWQHVQNKVARTIGRVRLERFLKELTVTLEELRRLS